MPYNGKTDWKLNDTVYPEDMNRIEGQIGKNTSEIEGVSGKIGNSSDGEEQLTLFGKLAAILTKVLGIDTKVGTSDDAKTKPTLFGKIAGIGDTLSENLTPVTEEITGVLNKVTGIDGKIGTSGDAAGTETLFGQVKDISEKMPTGIVKSIQRGLERCDTKTEVTISPVNMEKSIIIVNSDFSRINAREVRDVFGGMAARAGFTSSNKIYIVANIESKYSFNQLQINWQVVEFY